MKQQIIRYECSCDKCYHKWITRNDAMPGQCPKCKSFKWNDGVTASNDTAHIGIARDDKLVTQTTNQTVTVTDTQPVNELNYDLNDTDIP